GQVGDKGIIESESGSFEVTDTQKTPSNIILHRGKVVKGSVEVSQTALAHIKPSRRMAIMRNHTVTHLLQAALKQVVGKHITQAGSWVGPEGMRFDFSHSQACTQEELAEVERLVNKYILTGFGVKVEEMPIEKARERGAIAPFGEKYGHQVRVVQVGDNGQTISIEFCGGTHLDRVDRIGSFRLTAESSVAAGIRRIEGCTGQAAYESWAGTRDVVSQLSRRLAVKESQLLERVSALQDEIKKLNKDIKKAKQSQSSFSVDDLLNKAEEVDGIKLVTAKIEDGDPDMLRQAADQIRDKAGKVVCLLGTADEKKVSLICAVSKDETKRIQAGKVIKEVAQIVGGGGGGRPDLAQAGGKQPEKLDEAIEKASDIIKNMLQ
ncbi:MAG: DHHA1 domain-containing protein, partial [Candidatus Sumerlaeota bacterium]